MRRVLALLSRARDAYEAAYEARPYVTAAITAGILGGGGDIIAQKVVERKAEINWRRTAAIATASQGYAAGFYVAWLRFLGRFGEGTVAAVVIKTALDNFVATPFVYMPEFYIWSGAVKGMTVSESIAKLQDQYWESYVPCLALWIPAQVINFWLVPPPMRILFVYSTELVWNIMISYISSHADDDTSGAGTGSEGAPATGGGSEDGDAGAGSGGDNDTAGVAADVDNAAAVVASSCIMSSSAAAYVGGDEPSLEPAPLVVVQRRGHLADA